MSLLPEANVISFARGIPSPDMFPLEQLAESAKRAVERDGRVALNYGPPAGFGPLRDWLSERHGVPRDRVVVLPGSLIGLNFVVWHLLREGGTAIVEAPTYDRMLHTLAAAGVDVVTVDRDADGLDLDRLRTLAAGSPRPKLLYLLPTFHNPTGRTLTLEQRHALVELALEYELTVFEDDPYGLLRVEGEALPHVCELLRARGGDDLAVFSSSFSKVVAPGLRVGYLLLPQGLVAPVEALATRDVRLAGAAAAGAAARLPGGGPARAAPRAPPLVPAPAPRRAARRAGRTAAGACDVDAPGRRLLPLARAAGGDRRSSPERARPRQGGCVRAGSGVLPRRPRATTPRDSRSAIRPWTRSAPGACRLASLVREELER